MFADYFKLSTFEEFYATCLAYLSKKNISHSAPNEIVWEDTIICPEPFAKYEAGKIFKIERLKYSIDSIVLTESDLSYYSGQLNYLNFSVFVYMAWIKFEFIFDIEKNNLSKDLPADFQIKS